VCVFPAPSETPPKNSAWTAPFQRPGVRLGTATTCFWRDLGEPSSGLCQYAPSSSSRLSTSIPRMSPVVQRAKRPGGGGGTHARNRPRSTRMSPRTSSTKEGAQVQGGRKAVGARKGRLSASPGKRQQRGGGTRQGERGNVCVGKACMRLGIPQGSHSSTAGKLSRLVSGSTHDFC
jgi:hypothetical protein